MKAGKMDEYLLVIDEVHKLDNWSEAVKKEWDDDTFNDLNLKVVILGYSVTDSIPNNPLLSVPVESPSKNS